MSESDSDPDAAFDAFYAAARNNAALEPRTRLLLHLAMAMAVACEP